MDNSTLSFFALLIALFVVIKYMTSSPSSSPLPPKKSSSATNTNEEVTKKKRTEPTRPITKDMVEIVQQIGPQLTEEQIVYSLSQNGGSIEQTINEYLAKNSLPLAPVSKKSKKSKEGWADTREERTKALETKREEMIMKLRLRLKKQLANEIDL